jgi:glycosyltransferase involved in cell wall biosynthesis
MRVALVHDWYVQPGGGERVVEEILRCFPQAELFALVDFMPASRRGFLGGRVVTTSFLQKIPGMARWYRNFLPLMPLAVESLDVSGFDLVISTSHAVAKGVLTGPDQRHIAYVFSPMRYAWDLRHAYLRQTGNDRGLRGLLAGALLSRMRVWDAVASRAVDDFVADSAFIARRIQKYYRREAAVIYPPVDVETFGLGGEKQDYYLTVSRLAPYKRVDVMVEAFRNMPAKKLVVAGEGPEASRLAAGAPSNVEFRGRVEPGEAVRLMQGARGFLFVAEEDFGIAPLEAQACGTPVIAFGKGGALETVRPLGGESPTGIFFPAQTPESLREALDLFEANQGAFSASACRENALRFRPERFRREFMEFVRARLPGGVP